MATILKYPSTPNGSTERSSVNLLIVDDNRFIRYSLRQIIESVHDWKVCGEASDGAEALLKVGKLHPDLVIMDLQMPTMNGLEASRHISRLAPGLPIIMVTMFNTPQLSADAHSAGVREIVDKGANLANLLTKAIRAAIST